MLDISSRFVSRSTMRGGDPRRHPEVEQYQVRARAVADQARLAGILRETHLVPLLAQDLGQQLADADFVVYDQDLLHKEWKNYTASVLHLCPRHRATRDIGSCAG